jgi:CHAD domain-containing protein
MPIMARDSGPGTGGKLGAAVVAAGAVAITGKLARDRHSESERQAETAFCLYGKESIPDGIRRIVRGQLDQAHTALADSPDDALADAVHEARKSFKRLRATVRLARGAIGDKRYRKENTAFRDSARRLAGVRDASVLIETLANLSGDELPTGTLARLREQLESEREQALRSLRENDQLVAAVLGDLDEARARTAAWTFDAAGFEALEPGLRRIYRRGRKAMRQALADPADEHLHDWRKRVKDLWHAEQILLPAAPEKMTNLAKRTHDLSDLLGDDHDLAELSLYVARHSDCFDDGASQGALTAVIDRRRKQLQRQAFALGQELYRRKPKRFVKAIRKAWQKRAQPHAG